MNKQLETIHLFWNKYEPGTFLFIFILYLGGELDLKFLYAYFVI